MQNLSAPSDYAYGSGDEVLIRAWGGAYIDYRAVIDHNGVITIQTISTNKNILTFFRETWCEQYLPLVVMFVSKPAKD